MNSSHHPRLRRGRHRVHRGVSAAAAYMVLLSTPFVVGMGDCYDPPWIVGDPSTLQVSTSGPIPLENIEVDIEVTPLLAEVGSVRIDVWVREGELEDAGAATLYQAPFPPAADGGVSAPHGYELHEDYGNRYPTYGLVEVDCPDEACRTTVTLQLHSEFPATFEIQTNVIVVGPTEGDPAPGRITSVWRIVP